jgi:hypothetical protein
MVAEIRTAICNLMVVGRRDRIGVRRFDRPRVSWGSRQRGLVGPSSMVSAHGLRLLRSLLRRDVGRCDQLSNPGVGRSAKLMVQDQHNREGRSDYCKIKSQPPISMRMRIVAGRTVRARRSPRDSSPERTDRSREPATRIYGTDGRRDPPPSVTAESDRMTRNLRHA